MSSLDAEHVDSDVLHGRWFSLVPLNSRHLPLLYELGFRDQNSFRWRYRGTQPSFASFEQSLNAGVLCQFAICPNNGTDEFVGLVVAYNASPQDDFCYMAAITDRKFGSGTVEAVALFLRYLFRYWPIRKIYLEALEFNVPQYASAVRLGIFREEGRLRDHHFFDDRYWDLILYAIYREDAAKFVEDHANFLPEPELPGGTA